MCQDIFVIKRVGADCVLHVPNEQRRALGIDKFRQRRRDLFATDLINESPPYSIILPGAYSEKTTRVNAVDAADMILISARSPKAHGIDAPCSCGQRIPLSPDRPVD